MSTRVGPYVSTATSAPIYQNEQNRRRNYAAWSFLHEERPLANADHSGTGDLVVPAALLGVPDDREEAEAQRDGGDEVAHISQQRRAEADLAIVVRAHDLQLHQHLAWRRAAGRPEPDCVHEPEREAEQP